MRPRLTGGNSNALRAFIAAMLFCGFAIAVGLSAAPQLHDRLHKGDTKHECIATLLSSGSVEHASIEPAFLAPPLVLAPSSLLLAEVAIPRRTASSVLEHAPPARS